jgi:acyl-CoA synthetase (AMP-forming)/AMP-acid ligase II
LQRRSNQVANRLLEMGIRPGSYISNLGMNSTGFFDAWLAAGKIGCAFAPFNWRLAPAELAEIIEDAAPAIIFVDAAFIEKIRAVWALTSLRCEVVFFDSKVKSQAKVKSRIWLEFR